LPESGPDRIPISFGVRIQEVNNRRSASCWRSLDGISTEGADTCRLGGERDSNWTATLLSSGFQLMTYVSDGPKYGLKILPKMQFVFRIGFSAAGKFMPRFTVQVTELCTQDQLLRRAYRIPRPFGVLVRRRAGFELLAFHAH
jgi:hypothetical protein